MMRYNSSFGPYNILELSKNKALASVTTSKPAREATGLPHGMRPIPSLHERPPQRGGEGESGAFTGSCCGIIWRGPARPASVFIGLAGVLGAAESGQGLGWVGALYRGRFTCPKRGKRKRCPG